MANSPSSLKPLLVLVEDSAAEVHIAQRALRDIGRPLEMRVLRDGQEALDYFLSQDSLLAGKTCPALLLLDLHLPKVSGLEVLTRLRGHVRWRCLPIVVWSTSRQAEDIQAAYAAGANSYIEKPGDYDRFRTVLDTILRYWLDTALLPPFPGEERASGGAGNSA